MCRVIENSRWHVQLAGQPVPLVQGRLAAHLGDEPGVLHRDGGLVGHGREEGDLAVVGCVPGPVVGVERPEDPVVRDERDGREVLPLEAVELVVQRRPPGVGQHLRLAAVGDHRVAGPQRLERVQRCTAPARVLEPDREVGRPPVDRRGAVHAHPRAGLVDEEDLGAREVRGLHELRADRVQGGAQ
jgi:hypothetical protein